MTRRLQQRRQLLKIEKLRRATGAAGLPLAAWTALRRRWLKPGVKFDLVNHAYMAEIYNTIAREMMLLKAAQVGGSEYLISYSLAEASERGANVLYLFPTAADISDFSTARFGPALEASSYLEAKQNQLEGASKRADRVRLKRIGNAYIYLRGGHVKPDGGAPQLRSIDADIVIYDELDMMDARVPFIAVKRLGHSKISEQRWISTPTFVGAGIHAKWLESDQRSWFVRCSVCGTRQSLTIDHVVSEWDDLERPAAWHGMDAGTAWAACEKCGAKLDRLAPGTWVAAHPERDLVGFHISKLFLPTADLLELVTNLQTTDETKKREAVNQDLGLPYTPKGGQMLPEELDKARREYGPGPVSTGYAVVAGVDVGPRVLHVVIRAGARLCFAGRSTWENLLSLLRQYRVRAVVIDAQPEVAKARDFQTSFGAGCWLAYYVAQSQGLKKTRAIQIKKADGVVNLDRTRTIDAMFGNLRAGALTLPANARDLPEYYAHLGSLTRRLIETKGGPQTRYVQGAIPDHLAHAENYCLVAMSAELLPPSLPRKQLKKGSTWSR